MATRILKDHDVNTNSKKRKNARSDPLSADSKKAKQDSGDVTVATTETDPPKCGVLTSWREPSRIPVSEPGTSKIVFFDLETTSLKADCDITQISAVYENDIFNSYVIPDKMIDPRASEITGIVCYGDEMYVHDEPVTAVPPKEALENFLAWIEARSPVVMLAHNAQFDYTRLFHALETHNLYDKFSEHIEGFVDTLGLFKPKFPKMVNYKQETLAKKVLNKTYSSHNSAEDVKILRELYIKSEPHSFKTHSCTFTSAYNRWFYNKRKLKNKNAFNKMVKDGTLTTAVANRMVGSGLVRADLQKICKKSGEPELLALLNEKDKSGQPRVPEAENIVGKIFQHFKKGSKK